MEQKDEHKDLLTFFEFFTPGLQRLSINLKTDKIYINFRPQGYVSPACA